MKKTSFWIAVFFSIISSSSLNAQWELRSNGLPSSGITYALDASDSMTALISLYTSSSYSFYKTTDGGINWNPLTFHAPNKSLAVDVSIKDKDHIWAGMDDGAVYASSDGGNSWNLQWKDSTKSRFINYIEMFNLDDGIAMGDAPPSSDFNATFFTDESNGVAVGYNPTNLTGTIYRTTDAGNNWRFIHSVNNSKLNSVYFTDSQNGFAVGNNGTILKTTDGGSTWTNESNTSYGDLEHIYFSSSTNGFLFGDYSTYFLRTTDGGQTWNPLYQSQSPRISAIYFINSNEGWISAMNWGSESFLILKTTDGGGTWNEVNKGDVRAVSYAGLFFLDSNRGWETTGPFIYSTTDGGISWDKISDSTIVYPQTIYFSDANNGVAAGQHGAETTNDGGKTWTVVPSTSPYWIRSFSFLNPGTGYAVGAKNLALKTTDGGKTWIEKHYTTPGPALFIRTSDGGKTWNQTNTSYLDGAASGDIWRRLDFANNNTGFFYTSGIYPQQLYKTSDGGKTWSTSSFEVIPQVMKFYNSEIGLIFNSGGTTNGIPSKVYRTLDGGNTWQTFAPENIEVGGWGNGIAFLPNNSSKVWLTDGANLYFSGDTGRTWVNSTPAQMNGGGRDIVFTDDNYGWFACDHGIVFRTTNGYKSVTDIKNSNDISIKSFQLDQNYPNPFNPSTVISYQLPSDSRVTLKVYDELGRVVKTLVNQFQNRGSYKFNFDASQFSSGIFIYRLQTDGYTASKKMILLK